MWRTASNNCTGLAPARQHALRREIRQCPAHRADGDPVALGERDRDQTPSVVPVFFDLLAAERDWVQGYELNPPRGAVFRLDDVSLGAGAPKR